MTLDKSKPLTYEMAVRPEEIGVHKSWNSFNTGQLEGTLGYKKAGREMGQQLSKFDTQKPLFYILTLK